MNTKSSNNRSAKQYTSLSPEENYSANLKQSRLNTIEIKNWKFSTNLVLIIAILLAVVTGVAINFNTTYPAIVIIGGALGLILFVAILQRPELGAYLLIFSVFTKATNNG